MTIQRLLPPKEQAKADSVQPAICFLKKKKKKKGKHRKDKLISYQMKQIDNRYQTASAVYMQLFNNILINMLRQEQGRTDTSADESNKLGYLLESISQLLPLALKINK